MKGTCKTEKGAKDQRKKTEVTQSEPWGQEKETECQYREVQRDRHPKKQKGISARDEGRRPRWQRHRWIGWHPEKQSPRTDTKMAMKQETVWMGKTGEDRQASAKAGPQPQPLPDVSLTSPSHVTGGSLPSRLFQSYIVEEPLLFDPSTSVSLTDN